MPKLFKQFFCFCATALFLGSLFVAVPTEAQSIVNFYSDSDVPVILPRSTWDNDLSLNALLTWLPQTENGDLPSDWQSVERIVIHDTGCDASVSSCNNNTNPVATIQGIYRYHASTRGWGDIGYNYIIDQQGRIYEGRYGGNGSRGAHTYYDRVKDNFNYGSIGIVILGNYSDVQPPEAVYQSLSRLVSWLAVQNGLSPQGQSASFIWNASKGGFKSFFSGPVVLGHKDIEGGNPDPAMLDFDRLRREAGSFAAKYKDYAYQKNNGNSNIYKILSGARKIYNDLADFTVQGNSYSKLIALPATQLDLFSETRFLKYPDGTLVQIVGQPAIYLIQGAKKRGLAMTEKNFIKLGFDTSNVKQVTADELTNYPDGLLIKYGPDGQLISDSTKVYFVENGKKRWVTSGQLFSLLGYKWPKVKKLDSMEAVSYLDGPAMLYPEGALLREQGKNEVYLMRSGQKHQFVSVQSFLKLGYKWTNITLVNTEEIALASTGNIVSYADGTLIKAENSPTVFLVAGGIARPFLNAEIFLARGYKWPQVLSVSPDEMAYYPQGKFVGYPEGWLVRPADRNNVYLISGGEPQAIDAATFAKRKYKWASVKIVSAQEFGILYEEKSLAVLTAPAVSPAPSPSTVSTPTPTPTPSASPTPSSSGTMPKIRVAIFEVKTSSVTLSADSLYDILDKSGQIVATKNAGENFVYTIGAAASAFVKIVPRSSSGIVEIVSYEEHPSWKPTLNYNKFRGAIEIVYSTKSNKIWAVNELPLEDYLKGVAETNQGLNMEYLKTMSVAARTYAYHYLLKGGKYGSDEVYHITNTTSDQLYKGYGREPYASDVVTAAQATYGEMAVYNGQPIVTAYSSGAPELITSGSKSACSVWGGKYCQAGYEYLSGGVKDPVGTTYGYESCGVSGNHCVGLSGAGTRQLAAQGKTYKEILMYYYPGAEIKKIY